MNLKKSLLVLSAVLTASFAFAGNAYYMDTMLKPQPPFSTQTRQDITIYAYADFFEGFVQRVKDGNITEADAEILRAVETHMPPAIHAFMEASSVTDENQPSPEAMNEADRQLREAGRQVISLIVKQFDFKKINQILNSKREDKNGPLDLFPPVFSAKHLDKPLMDLFVLDLSTAYLSSAQEISAEETILLQFVLKERAKKFK